MDMFEGDFNSTQTGGGAAEPTKNEGVVSAFIKQVLDSEDDFKLWDMTFGMVACVAIVRSIDTSSTKITYLLEDCTGRIEAHCWLEEGNEHKAPDVMINNYAKVFGSVRSQGGRKTLMVFKILPISDPNEICTHILEVLNARYKSETMASSEPNIDFGVPHKTSSNNLGLEGKYLAVFEAIKSNVSEVGISRDELLRKFAHIKKDELNSIVDFLTSEGHVYSSVDSDHFLCTE